VAHTFSESFEHLWEEAGFEATNRNLLCGVYYQKPNSNVEIAWRPESTQCPREQAARRVFKQAIELTSAETRTSDHRPYALVEPTMGHIAFKVFEDSEAVLRTLAKVAILRPFIAKDAIG
jgi:hypothetical protein